MNIHDLFDRRQGDEWPSAACPECGACKCDPVPATADELAAETQRRDREWRQAVLRAQP